MRKWIAVLALAALLVCALAPGVSFTEDRDTVLLARAIYALARNESYDTKLAIGTVAMNRLDNVWFADTLGGVLNEQHQFPIGSRYDDESLSAAHAVLSGRRALSADALYYQSLSASRPRTDKPLAVVGSYAFYS
ncbi:MAG: cell wall hydrolase [Clostridia bacterium]|nr:cell wall hydrolase [Clostridia bacterium]